MTGVGLGASNISIVDGYFTQVMGNGITAGGIQANGHHPSDPRMTNSGIVISGNILYNNSALFTSTVPIFLTYVQYSTVSHNDISMATYSGICHGYGWGSNDEGGSVWYEKDGLYKYQPEYQTPSTMKNNLIDGNLIHHYGYVLKDLGGIYSLGRAPETFIINNYMYDSPYKGLYPDEGSSNLTFINNLGFSDDLWYGPNDEDVTFHTGNLTLVDNWGKFGDVPDGFPNHTGNHSDTFIRNFIVADVSQTSAVAQKAAYRAGILPGRRAGRPISNNATLADGFLAIGSSGGHLAVNVTNFDDVDFTGLTLDVWAEDSSLESITVPGSVPANNFAVATYQAEKSGEQKYQGYSLIPEPADRTEEYTLGDRDCIAGVTGMNFVYGQIRSLISRVVGWL